MNRMIRVIFLAFAAYAGSLISFSVAYGQTSTDISFLENTPEASQKDSVEKVMSFKSLLPYLATSAVSIPVYGSFFYFLSKNHLDLGDGISVSFMGIYLSVVSMVYFLSVFLQGEDWIFLIENSEARTSKDFHTRFIHSHSERCEYQSLGGRWIRGVHAILELKVFQDELQNSCLVYYFESTNNVRGVNQLSSSFDIVNKEIPEGPSVAVKINDEEIVKIKDWLVQFDKKNLSWNLHDNSCIDFVLNAFKVLKREACMLPFLSEFSNGFSTTKMTLLKYIFNTNFHELEDSNICMDVSSYEDKFKGSIQSFYSDFLYNQVLFLNLLIEFINPSYVFATKEVSLQP